MNFYKSYQFINHEDQNLVTLVIFNQVRLVFLDIEEGRIHLTNDPLTFYWSSHKDEELTLYCSNTEFILEQQFLLEQGSTWWSGSNKCENLTESRLSNQLRLLHVFHQRKKAGVVAKSPSARFLGWRQINNLGLQSIFFLQIER